jgi:glycosyltransferase involved in cell wall biosynthesis
MPPITAILHTCNDAVRLGRALETLYPCDEILVVDHGSSDATLHVARQHAARISIAVPGQTPSNHAAIARHDWILCLLPSESLSEGLQASLYEWKLYESDDVRHITACSVFVRMETEQGWQEQAPNTRLVPRAWNRWNNSLPTDEQGSMLLQGDLLRFSRP